MINYFVEHFLHKKMQAILMTIFIVIGLLFFSMTEPFTPKAYFYLDLNSYKQSYYFKTTQILNYVFLFIISVILIDHDRDFLKPLIVRKGRFQVAFYKLFFYTLIMGWLYLVIFSLLILIPSFLTVYFNFDLNLFKNVISIIINGYLLMLFLLIVVKKNFRPITFLILILFLTIILIYEDNKTSLLFLGYLLPLANSFLYQTNFGYLYLILYFIILIFIYFLVELKRNIT